MAHHSIQFVGDLDHESVIRHRLGLVNAGTYRGDQCLIDLNRVTFALPCGMAALAALVVKLLADDLTVRLSAEKSGAFQYMQNMNLFQQMGVQTDEEFNRRPQGGRFCRMVRVDFMVETEQLSRDMLAVVQPNDSSVKADLANCLSESLSNLWAHARIAGFALAQSFERGTEHERYELAVADCGGGILQSLREAYEIKDDKHALELACQRGVTSYKGNPRSWHYGMGLFHIDEVAKAANGSFTLCSGNWKRVRRGADVAYYPVSGWPGTIMTISLNRSGIMNAQIPPHTSVLRHV